MLNNFRPYIKTDKQYLFNDWNSFIKIENLYMLKLRYKNDDILYVPTNSLDSVRKYIGAGEASPKINKLGGKEWESTKKKVKSNLREVARELIELYAKRQKGDVMARILGDINEMQN